MHVCCKLTTYMDSLFAYTCAFLNTPKVMLGLQFNLQTKEGCETYFSAILFTFQWGGNKYEKRTFN